MPINYKAVDLRTSEIIDPCSIFINKIIWNEKVRINIFHKISNKLSNIVKIKEAVRKALICHFDWNGEISKYCNQLE